MANSIVLQTKQLCKQVQSGDALLHILTNINLTISAGETVAVTAVLGTPKI